MNLQVRIKDKIAAGDGSVIVCGNSDYVVHFDFDTDWGNTKTMRVNVGGTYIDTIFNGNSCALPIIENALSLSIGVYAGNISTTTPALFKCAKSIRSDGGAPVDPTPSVYDQIMSELSNKVNTSDYAPGEKTEDMTQPVGKDEDGKLWTAPGGGGGTGDFDDLTNRPSYNGAPMTHSTNIPEVRSAAWDAKGTYSKPTGGIPSGDMTAAVQASLGKADSAVQADDISDMATQTWVEGKGYLTQHQSLSAYRTASAQDIIDAAKANSADLATVATSGDYNDLSNKPAIPTAEDVSFDPTGTDLEAIDVQAAIDEVASDIGNAVKVTEQTFTDAQKEQARTNIGAGNVTKVKVNGTEKAPNASGVVDIGTVVTDVSGKENTSNKITDITAVSTDTQYPSAKAVYKMFQNVCLVAVDSMNTEYGSVTDISGVYSAGTTLTAVATANEGYRFMKWINGYTRDTVSTEASYEFTVSGNTNLMAIFIDESIELVPWASGTDEQIRKIVEAATFGSISLSDVWAVGDTRTVHLSSMEATGVGESHAEQDVEFVIMDFVCDGFSAGGTKPNAIVGLKNGLVEKGYMNSSNTNYGGWRDCKRRAWCNSVFKNAVPSSFRSIFKEFTWQQGAGGGASSGLITTVDTFALPPEKAIFGSRSYSFADEAALYNHWKWYQTSSNRVKKNGASGSASYWWEASPYSGLSRNFCGVDGNGSANSNIAGGTNCLAPFGCI